MGESKTSPRRVEAKERMAQAVELRKRGMTYQAIADALGYAHPGAAHKAVTTALRETMREPADELRTLELERLDAIMAANWDKATGEDPDERAATTVLRVMEARRKLLGLDAPAKVEAAEGATLGVIVIRPPDGSGS